jgi:predicted membrane channel-forming protein YqfA (hemolysin III family)
MFDNLSFKARRWLALLVLVVGMPLYIVVCVTVVNWLERPPLLLELVIYVALGLVWIFPFKGLFKGIGKPDPDAPPVTWDDER